MPWKTRTLKSQNDSTILLSIKTWPWKSKQKLKFGTPKLGYQVVKSWAKWKFQLQHTSPMIKSRLSLPIQAFGKKASSWASTVGLSPQGIGGDGHNALRTLFRGKARCKFQGLIRQGGEMETRLVRIAQPWAAWHGQHLREEKNTSNKLGKNSNTACWANILPIPKLKTAEYPNEF